MHTPYSRDGDKTIDWGKTSSDYTLYRPGPPTSFYARLADCGVGVAGQAILDLGTGTGVLARQFARQGCAAFGVDVSENQIAAAKELAMGEGVVVDFRAHPAESLPWTSPTFDAATANQCWLYFDHSTVIEELRRVLISDGLLVTSHFSWLPREDSIARRTEELILKFNPDWSSGDWDGIVPDFPRNTEGAFEVVDEFIYDEPIEFTHESWRGRIRACRGVGAALTDADVSEFDTAHEALLRDTVENEFTVLHRIDAHVLRFAGGSV